MREVVYEAVIRTEPKGKKNSMNIAYNKKTGRQFIVQSDAYKKFEKDCQYFLTNKPDAPIDYPVNVEYKMYRATNRTFDASNGISALDDILVKLGILKDDNFKIVAGHDGTRVYVDKYYPRIEVIITKMEAEDL